VDDPFSKIDNVGGGNVPRSSDARHTPEKGGERTKKEEAQT
jgi:hypothetical protein